MQYQFNRDRFALRGWDGHGGVVYDEADSTLYELSESAFVLLSLIEESGAIALMDLMFQVLSEVPTPEDLSLAQQLLEQFVGMGVLTCESP